MLPVPTTSTPCVRSPASARPSASTSFGPAPMGRATCTTGTSACGYRCISGTQVPWSSGRCGSACAAMPAWPSRAITSRPRLAEPGAGYCNWYSSAGKPPKSCQVAGAGLVMTAAPRAIQCGDITTMPRRPSAGAWAWAQARRAGPVVPGSVANKGAPCDTNRAGKAVADMKLSFKRAGENCIEFDRRDKQAKWKLIVSNEKTISRLLRGGGAAGAAVPPRARASPRRRPRSGRARARSRPHRRRTGRAPPGCGGADRTR